MDEQFGSEKAPALFSAVAQRGSRDTDLPGVGDGDGFVHVRRNRKRNTTKPADGLGSRQPSCKIASRLEGAKRIKYTPFHLSRVSPSSTVEDVVTHCRLKGITVTDCYPIHTRVWGTQSMKFFTESAAVETILKESFWPDVICRKWMKNPPRGPGVSQCPDTRSA